MLLMGNLVYELYGLDGRRRETIEGKLYQIKRSNSPIPSYTKRGNDGRAENNRGHVNKQFPPLKIRGGEGAL